jgi:hypothetical protein
MQTQMGYQFLQDLPLILAGPILRRTEPDAVTVWVALKHACQVDLKVCGTTHGGQQLADWVLEGSRATMAIGKFLHVVAVTARSATGAMLSHDRIYAYDLQFTIADQPTQTLQQALCSRKFPKVNISYFKHQAPTFVLPAKQLEHLRIVHGSCRNSHGGGFDALPILDCLLEETAQQPQQRPQQLFLTGDQIYGDDVANPLLWVASTLGDLLMGWEEKLPIGHPKPTDSEYCTPKELPVGQRSKVATMQAGFTAGLRQKQEKVDSHLFSLAEYCASYVLMWSPICWVSYLPRGRDLKRIGIAAPLKSRKAIQTWDDEVINLQRFIYTLWKVRRAFANIPVYTIFDDHDVSDDWNLNRAWCLRVLGRPLGRRVVQNALLAYTIFQAWGNTPAQFEVGQPGEQLLLAAQAWSMSQGTDTVAEATIARYVGMPTFDSKTGLPTFVQDESVLIIDRHPDTLTWHYTLHSDCHEVIVLDTRTWRGYPAEQKATASPMLLCPQAFTRQLTLPLSHSPSSKTSENKDDRITIVIAPTNVFGLKVLDWIHKWHQRQNKVFTADVGDAWNIHDEALAQLLTTLFQQRQQLIILSGDIHHSFAVRLSYATATPSEQSPAVLVQLTASAFKNEEFITKLIHTRLKEWLLPEKKRRWVGWSSPPNMLEVSSPIAQRRLKPLKLPDWQAVLEWVPQQSIQNAPFGTAIGWLMPPQHWEKAARWRWLRPLMLWNSRWFQTGREVVGLNNLALVQFQLTDQTSAPIVMQDTYWFSTWHPTQIVYSRFEVQLAPNLDLINESRDSR